MKKISALDAARHIIAVATVHNKVITCLQMETILWLVYKEFPSMFAFGKSDFQACRYGFLIPDVHMQYKEYGGLGILEDPSDDKVGNFSYAANTRVVEYLDEPVYKLINQINDTDEHKQAIKAEQ